MNEYESDCLNLWRIWERKITQTVQHYYNLYTLDRVIYKKYKTKNLAKKIPNLINKALVEEALKANAGNKFKAAEDLGMNRGTFYKYLRMANNERE